MGRVDRKNVEGGMNAQRGFIFQSIIAMIECLERDDWDEIKMEPGTELDKVDIMLYRDGQVLSAIQVKSSKNPFTDSKAKKWLQDLKNDANGVKEICLCLVGDSFNKSCEEYIDNTPEIRKAPFQGLPSRCTEALTSYIKKSGIVGDVRGDDLELVDDRLFAKIHRNSISKNPISRSDFEEAFRNAMPVHTIPLCLTFIPAINQEVGLIGRDDVKRTIRAMLEENSCTALVSGVGGIGKTAVMRYICHDLKNEGKYVAWVECGDNLRDDLLQLRTALGIPDTDSVETAYKKIINEIRSRLSGRMYFFMDNLSRIPTHEEQDVLISLGIHVMATSRFEHEYFTNLSLDILEKKSAIDMFYGYYKGDKERRYADYAWEIIDSVHSHTLLVELLAKAAWEEGGTLESFCDILKEEGFFRVSDEAVWTDHDSLQRTIEECIRKLYEISDLPEIQRHIMRLFTIFTPEKEIYYKVRDWGDLDRHGLRKLVTLGWLDRGGLENGYRIHQVVKDSLAKQMEHNGEDVDLEDYGNLLEKAMITRDYLGETVTYEFVRERIVFTEDISIFLEKKATDLLDSGNSPSNNDGWFIVAGVLLNNLAGVLQDQGEYAKAIYYYKKSIIITDKLYGKKPSTALTYHNLATLFTDIGEYESAQHYFQMALEIFLSELGEEDPNTAMTYDNIGKLYIEIGDFNKALECLQRALDIRKKILGEEHIDTGVTYNGLGRVFLELGDYNKSLEYYQKDFSIAKKMLGTKHPEIAAICHNMAEVYTESGDYEKAINCHQEALDIREKILGPDNLSTASTYNALARLFRIIGKYDEALAYYQKALEIRQKILGEENVSTAKTYNNMAEVFADQGEYKWALELHMKSYAILERRFGAEHVYTASVCSNIATAYLSLGNYAKAIHYFRKSLKVLEDKQGASHPDLAATYNCIADMYANMEQYDKALLYHQKAISIYEKTWGCNHVDLAMPYSGVAYVYVKQGKFDNALEYYQKALRINEEVLGTGHPATAMVYDDLAGMYAELDEYGKAMKYYKKALDVFVNSFGEEHPNTKIIQENMDGLLEEMKKNPMSYVSVVETV